MTSGQSDMTTLQQPSTWLYRRRENSRTPLEELLHPKYTQESNKIH